LMQAQCVKDKRAGAIGLGTTTATLAGF
jgi:hypothetical protein